VTTPAPGGRTRDVRKEIARASVEDALENDRCGICGSIQHFREDHPADAPTAVETVCRVRELADDIDYCWDDENTTVAVVVAAIRRALGDEP
jgi:hypothetical protein